MWQLIFETVANFVCITITIHKSRYINGECELRCRRSVTKFRDQNTWFERMCYMVFIWYRRSAIASCNIYNVSPFSVDVFRDPVEIECGHLFCRVCITQLTCNSFIKCPLCQTQVSKQNLKKLSARKNTLATSICNFLKDFCNEGDFIVGMICCYCSSSVKKIWCYLINLSP